MNRTKKIVIAVSFFCLLGLAGGLILDHNYGNKQSNGSTATDFKVTDVSGNEVSLSDFKGKTPVIVNFATSWCTYCKQEMPDFQKAYEKYGDKVQFMVIDCIGASGETKKSFQKFIASGGYTMPVYYDNEQIAQAAYGINSFPQTYFIGKDGKLVNQFLGATNYTELEKAIKSLI
jgi:cytochrome c biogenesis protein CcmG/thiol:disulfide interchange protein DsbE